MKELIIIKIFATGRTEPHAPFGIEIILIQQGIVQVGRLLQDPEDKNSVYIDHPKNQSDLDIQATKEIKEQNLNILKATLH